MKRNGDAYESPRFSMTLHNPYDQYEKTYVARCSSLSWCLR